jgi:sirohydrochlorin ferrochelatase
MTKTALIVSHGQPSDPGQAERALADLARRVGQHLPGWQVLSATLAQTGALAAAVAGRGPGVVYPMFMAGGWFPTVELPRRMAEAGAEGWVQHPPFGLDPGVQALAVRMAQEAAAERGQAAGETAVLLAAHGSFRSPAPSEVARALAGRLAGEGFAPVKACFIDQEPRIAQATGFGPRSICLPFFAAEGGHVTDDLPAALAEAGFEGRVLPTLGLDPRVPGLIAAALSATAGLA